MLRLIQGPVAQPDGELREVALRVARRTLAKRYWRATAEDGVEFGFEVSAPLKDGETIWQAVDVRYVIRQEPEPVLEISLNVTPAAAAGIGWAVGNLHLELSAEPARLLAPDEPAVRQLLGRIAVPFTSATAIFRPGRFVRGPQAAHELGPSHQH